MDLQKESIKSPKKRRKLDITQRRKRWNKIGVYQDDYRCRHNIKIILINNTLVENKDEFIKDDEKFTSHLINQNKIYQNVSFPSEAVPDSKLLHVVASYHHEKTTQLSNIAVPTVREFIKGVISHLKDYDNESINWIGISRVAPNSLPFVSFLNGPLLIEEKIRKKPTVFKRMKISESIVPQSISKAEDELKTATDQRITKLDSLVKDKIELKRLVVNPHPSKGFGQTIENIFDLSFLLKEGIVSIDDDNNVSKKKPNEKGTVRSNVMKFNYDIYKQILKGLDSKSSYIPTRD